MEQAKRNRAAQKGWLTRASIQLRSEIENGGTDGAAYEVLINTFESRLAKYEEAVAAVEMCIVKEEELEAEINTVSEFLESFTKLKIDIMKMRKKEVNALAADFPMGSEAALSRVNNGDNIKLPRIEISKFNGDVTKWQSFWDKFNALIDKSNLPKISKFSYLESFLEGEAKTAISGLSLTDSNYDDACQLLIDRFGRKEKIIFSHIQKLLNISVSPTIKQNNVASLWKVQDDLLTHIRSLRSLGIDGDQYGVILTPMILSRLPAELRMEWAREGEGKESNLSWLLEFLKKEIERRERSRTFEDDSKPILEEKRKPRYATAAALQTSSISGTLCGFCGGGHPTERCWKVTKLPIQDRHDRIRASRLCFRCLRSNHIAKNCNATCTKCSGKHHALCCRGNERVVSGKVEMSGSSESVPVQYENATENDNKVSSNVNVSCSSLTSTGLPTKRSSVLQMAKAFVAGQEGGDVEVNILFDSGSDRSFVTESLVKKIKPTFVQSEPVSYVSFGNRKANKSVIRGIYEFDLQGRDRRRRKLVATEMPVICANISTACLNSEILEGFNNLELANSYSKSEIVTIDILIGLDYYWDFVSATKVMKINGIVAQETPFGWILSGSCSTDAKATNGFPCQLLCLNDIPESVIRNMWELESIGIVGAGDVVDQNLTLKRFEKSVKFKDERYEVALPWKQSGQNDIVNNEGLATHRLNSLSRKLSKDPELAKQYDEVLCEMENNGVIHEVPKQEYMSLYPTYYMPHRPVVRESSASTRIRPVFDGSAPSYNGLSLNNCLETGPNLIPNLPEMLIRFRRWKVALIADISKAFLQIRVRREDQDVHRFLWNFNGTRRIMRFDRVPFGNKSSPFLLNATIRHHLASCSSTKTVRELQDNLYVDDWLSGADSEQEACQMFKEAREIMIKANFSLSKWESNSKEVSDMIYREFEGKHLDSESVKVLGMKWIPNEDCFSYEVLNVPLDFKVTKRSVLSCIARLFDPLGFLTPFVMWVKILFQELWILGVEWDGDVPPDIENRFNDWLKGVHLLQDWRVPRRYTNLTLKQLDRIEIHGFGDASEKGYGACVYIKAIREGHFPTVLLVISKAKVAPIKKITIPRLELIGALLCARLVTFVLKSLQCGDNVSYTCWTDSTVSLAWIKGNPNKWKPFVSNRVSEIQTLTDPSHWYHCSGKDNPADLVTRGLLAENLIRSDLWLKGPAWLSDEVLKQEGKLTKFVTVEESENLNPENPFVSLASVTRKPESVLEIEQWSNFTKVLRIVGWILRFINNASKTKENKKGDLDIIELNKSKLKLLTYVQNQVFFQEIKDLEKAGIVSKGSPLAKLTPFIGKDNLLRVKGRLQFSDLSAEEKHPIILPRTHLTQLLVTFQHKLMKHAGVNTMISTLRNAFWIIGIRRLAKKVKRECVFCQRHDSRACTQQVSPLPELRVRRASPFAITGLDYAGPLYCSDYPKGKFYVLLFTCAVVRAIHLELVQSLSLENFMCAFRRFSSRRGQPSYIYSDNASTFKAAKFQLQKEYAHLAPEWRYIAPLAPWWGGWWERLMRPIKSSLKKSIGSKLLDRTELETMLHEIEACLNARPLTFVGDEIDSGQPLTPFSFLIGKSSHLQPDRQPAYLSNPVARRDFIGNGSIRRQLLATFWSRWQTDYLRNLPPLSSLKSKENLKKGTIVLLKEDLIPRFRWPLGIIDKVHYGKDGLVRCVDLQTQKGIKTRPIQRLHNLEIVHQFPEERAESDPTCNPDVNDQVDLTDSVGDSEENVPDVKRSRYGRLIKPRKPFDL